MELLYNIILALAGIGVLLYGVRSLNQGLESALGVGFKKVLTKAARNKIKSYGLGAGVTTAVQSNTLTISMITGFINVGAISLAEGLSMMLGAAFGSAIALVLLAFDSISLVKIFTIFCLVGAFLFMFFKKTNIKRIATVLMGFGLICLGLSLIGSNLGFIVNEPSVYNWISTLTNPFVLFLVGALICFVTDSTYATIAMLIALVGSVGMTGPMSIDSAAIVLMGACFIGGVPTLVYNISNTSPDGKRALFFYMFFKMFAAILFGLFMFIPWINPFYVALGEQTGLFLIMIFLIMMFVPSIIFLPFTKYLSKFMKWLIRPKKVPVTAYDKFIPDDNVIKIFGLSYSWLINSICELIRMEGDLAEKFVMRICDKNYEEKGTQGKIKALEKITKLMNNNVIRISANQSEANLDKMNVIMGILNDTNHLLERIQQISKYGECYKNKPRSMTIAEAESIFPIWMGLRESLELLISLINTMKDMTKREKNAALKVIFSLTDKNAKEIAKTRKKLFNESKKSGVCCDNSLYLNILLAIGNMNADIANIAIKFGILEN